MATEYIQLPYDCYQNIGSSQKGISGNYIQCKQQCNSNSSCLGFSTNSNKSDISGCYLKYPSPTKKTICTQVNKPPGPPAGGYVFYLRKNSPAFSNHPDVINNFSETLNTYIKENENSTLVIEKESVKNLPQSSKDFSQQNDIYKIKNLEDQISKMKQKNEEYESENEKLNQEIKKDFTIIDNVTTALQDPNTYKLSASEFVDLFNSISAKDTTHLNDYLLLYAYFKYYYNNRINNVETKNNELNQENDTYKIEIKYRLNDIYIKNNKIDILKLLVTGVLLSLVVLMLNKITSDELEIPVTNIVAIIMTIFIFIIIIRILRNLNKRQFNFREYKYIQHPGDRTFWGKIGHMLYNLIPSSNKDTKIYPENNGETDIPHGNV